MEHGHRVPLRGSIMGSMPFGLTKIIDGSSFDIQLQATPSARAGVPDFAYTLQAPLGPDL